MSYPNLVVVSLCSIVLASCGFPQEASFPVSSASVSGFVSVSSMTGVASHSGSVSLPEPMSDSGFIGVLTGSSVPADVTHIPSPGNAFTPVLHTGAVLPEALRTRFDALAAELVGNVTDPNGSDFKSQAAILRRYADLFVGLARSGLADSVETLVFPDMTWEAYIPFATSDPAMPMWKRCDSPAPGEYEPPCVFVDRLSGRIIVPDEYLGDFSGMTGTGAIMSFGVGGGCGGSVSHRLIDSSFSVISQINQLSSDCGPLHMESFVRADPVSGHPSGPAIVLVSDDQYQDASSRCVAAGFLRQPDDFPDSSTVRDLRVFESEIPCGIDIDQNLVSPNNPLLFKFGGRNYGFPPSDFSGFSGRWDASSTGSILDWNEETSAE